MLDGRVLGASQVEYIPFGKRPLKRENRHLRRRVDGLNDIIDRERERARERVEELELATEFSACGWRTLARSLRKRANKLEDALKKIPSSCFLAFSLSR